MSYENPIIIGSHINSAVILKELKAKKLTKWIIKEEIVSLQKLLYKKHDSIHYKGLLNCERVSSVSDYENIGGESPKAFSPKPVQIKALLKDKRFLSKAFQEIEIIAKLQHPSIIKLLGICYVIIILSFLLKCHYLCAYFIWI